MYAFKTIGVWNISVWGVKLRFFYVKLTLSNRTDIVDSHCQWR